MAILLAGAALTGGCGEADSATGGSEHLAECTVAVISGRHLTDRDARNIQALIQPTPSLETARRLLVDVALSHRIAGESIETSQTHEWLLSYRRLHDEARRNAQGQRRPIDVVLEKLEAAKVAHGFEAGNCRSNEET